MKLATNATIFTATSVLALFFQYYLLNKNIEKLREENVKLVNYIKVGHRKHLAVLKEKDTEKEALIASYEYTINKEKKEDKQNPDFKVNEDFKQGYTEGYHRAIEQSYCPVEHTDRL